MNKRVIVIVGATGGIGRELSKNLSDISSRLVLVSRSEEKLKALQSELSAQGAASDYCVVDFADSQNAERVLLPFLQKYTKVDVLINCVGDFLSIPTIDMTLARWNEIFSINCTSCFLTTKHVLPIMQKHKSGFIINFSSIGGTKGLSGKSAYCASKHAIRGYTDALREEYKADRIKFLTVYPYLVDSEGQIDFSAHGTPELSILAPSDVAQTLRQLILHPHRLSINDLHLTPLY